MQRLIAALLIAIPVRVLLCLIGIPIVVAVIQRRRDRRRIMAEARAATPLSELIPDARSVLCRVLFSFQPKIEGRPECKQGSTVAAIQALGLGEGSQVRVRYLPEWPRYAFIDSLVIAERLATLNAAAAGNAASGPVAPAVHFISYVDPKSGMAAANAFRWTGDGDITIGGGDATSGSRAYREADSRDSRPQPRQSGSVRRHAEHQHLRRSEVGNRRKAAERSGTEPAERNPA